MTDTDRAREIARTVAKVEEKGLPDGWVAVPKEPTGKQIVMGRKSGMIDATSVYHAMLEARPPLPQESSDFSEIDAPTEIRSKTNASL